MSKQKNLFNTIASAKVRNILVLSAVALTIAVSAIFAFGNKSTQNLLTAEATSLTQISSPATDSSSQTDIIAHDATIVDGDVDSWELQPLNVVTPDDNIYLIYGHASVRWTSGFFNPNGQIQNISVYNNMVRVIWKNSPFGEVELKDPAYFPKIELMYGLDSLDNLGFFDQFPSYNVTVDIFARWNDKNVPVSNPYSKGFVRSNWTLAWNSKPVENRNDETHGLIHW
jgi:hypothetical protein